MEQTMNTFPAPTPPPLPPPPPLKYEPTYNERWWDIVAVCARMTGGANKRVEFRCKEQDALRIKACEGMDFDKYTFLGRIWVSTMNYIYPNLRDVIITFASKTEGPRS